MTDAEVVEVRGFARSPQDAGSHEIAGILEMASNLERRFSKYVRSNDLGRGR